MKRRVILITSAIILISMFSVFVLEKAHVINLYEKKSSSTAVTGSVNTADYSPDASTENNDINQAKLNGTIDKNSASRPINITLTRASQDVNKNLVVRTLIGGVSSGTCILELSQGQSAPAVTKNASISQQNNIFLCNGFDISYSELPGVGEWTIKVIVDNGSQSADVMQNIILEK